MKLTFVFLTAFLLHVSAKSSAQKVTLNVKNVTLDKVFREIERQTGYGFLFTKKMLKDADRVTLDVKDKPVADVLQLCFSNQPLNYTIENNTIVISRKLEVIQQATPVTKAIRNIHGIVKDEKGNPLAGVSVIIKGTPKGTSTDTKGSFTIDASIGDVLEFTIIGYQKRSVTISKNNNLSIVMKIEVSAENDIVVVGYGTQTKKDITTSIAIVRGSNIDNMPISNFAQGLVGKMPGVQVIQNSGKPNASLDIRVRGTGSITAGISPLYVINGMPLDENIEPQEAVDLNDIATIQVLKDAAAAAIYGSRGANGVVIITTKEGGNEKMKVNFRLVQGVQKVTKEISMLNAYQYAQFSADGHNGAYLSDNPSGSPSDSNDVRPNSWDKIPPELFPYLNNKPGLTNTNWQDQIFRNAPFSNYSLSLSGGNKISKFYLSGNYLDQNGIIINSGYKRMSTRLDYLLQTGKIKISANFSPSYSIEKRVNSDGTYNQEGIVQSALGMTPIWPVKNTDGTYNQQGNGFWRIGTDYQHNEIINPVAEAMLIKDNISHVNLLGNVSLDWEIIKNLHYKLATGTTYNHYFEDYYRPSTLPNLGYKYYGIPSNPTGKTSTTYFLNWLIENTLTYKKSLGQHHINALIGFTVQKNKMEQSSFSTTGAPNDLIENAAAGTTVSQFKYDDQAYSLVSILGRIQYDYQNRYLLTGSLRSDGSSRFGADNKWGYFPSLSAGWIISSEKFMERIPWISLMKLKTSYGISGNFNIGNYQQSAILLNQNAILGQTQVLVPGLAPSQFDNPNLSWEKTAMTNIGLSTYFMNNRVGFEIEFYNSNTKSMLLNVPVPTITGIGTALQNIGEVNNKGIEFTILGNNQFGKFSWNAQYSISANRNKVVRLDENNTPIITTAGGVSSAYFITEVDKPIGSYYLLKYDGIFKNQHDLDNYPHFSTTQVGDFKFVDIDGNDTMDVSKDRTIVGNYQPKFIYSFVNDFSYKAFDLSFALQGVYGNQILNLQRRYIANMEGNMNNMTLALERYRSPSEPGNGLVNRANRKSTGNNSTISSWHVESGSYLRLQNVTFGYQIPKNILAKLKINSLKIYFSAQNILTITKYSGYNPEVNLYGTSNQLTSGVDYGSYPLAKTYSLGLNVTF